MYAIGPDVELTFGRIKFIVIYLVAGLVGNIASCAFCPEISVGASGAIFGLLGALLYVGLTYKDFMSEFYVTNIVIMIALNLGYGFVNAHIDNYAHMGGLVGGYLSAVTLGLGFDNRFTIKKGAALLCLCTLIICGIFLGRIYPAL